MSTSVAGIWNFPRTSTQSWRKELENQPLSLASALPAWEKRLILQYCHCVREDGISELWNSHGPFFHIKVIRELTFLKTKKSWVIALTCWSSRRCPKPFCGNKRHGLWDEKEGEIIGQSTHMMNTLEVDLSKWMTCAKVRLVAQTLLRLGKPVKVITPSLILFAYIWKQNCQPQFWALGLGMIEAIPLSTWSFRCMGKTGEQARSWSRALGKAWVSLGSSCGHSWWMTRSTQSLSHILVSSGKGVYFSRQSLLFSDILFLQIWREIL